MNEQLQHQQLRCVQGFRTCTARWFSLMCRETIEFRNRSFPPRPSLQYLSLSLSLRIFLLTLNNVPGKREVTCVYLVFFLYFTHTDSSSSSSSRLFFSVRSFSTLDRIVYNFTYEISVSFSHGNFFYIYVNARTNHRLDYLNHGFSRLQCSDLIFRSRITLKTDKIINARTHTWWQFIGFIKHRYHRL